MLYASEVAVAHRNLATVDLVIIGVYFAIVFGIGMYFARKERTSEDYFLAGRDIGWFFIGASLFVSNISTEHFIGLSGTGASSGLAVGHFEWLACLILLILGWVFVPFYLRSNVFTMPEFLERRFNRQSAVYLAGISIIAYIFTKISVQLYAASVVLERVAGWSLWKTAVVLVIATGIYTVAGGLAAVIYTDTVQTLILITGAVALTVIGLGRVGGLAHLRTMVPPDYFHMIKPISDPNFPWTGIFFGAPILGIWYWCTDQVIVQRVLSARDEGHAKAGTIFAGFLKILPVFMLVLPGIIAFALFPEQVRKPDFAYPTLVLNLLPVGLVGLVMAALLAAVLGATRFILELADRAGGSHFQSSAVRWLIDMNFLHYAIFMFVVCSAVLIAVSLMTPAPDRKRLAGLTFATVDEKMEAVAVGTPVRKPAHETPMERRINGIFSLLLLATVIGLWIYFR